jgi:hypothetical protein
MGGIYMNEIQVSNIGGIIPTAQNRRFRKKTCLSDTYSTTNSTWTELGSKSGLRGVWPDLLMVQTIYGGVWPGLLIYHLSTAANVRFGFALARYVQYMRDVQIHISLGGGVHQLQKSTHIQGSDFTPN